MKYINIDIATYCNNKEPIIYMIDIIFMPKHMHGDEL